MWPTLVRRAAGGSAARSLRSRSTKVMSKDAAAPAAADAAAVSNAGAGAGAGIFTMTQNGLSWNVDRNGLYVSRFKPKKLWPPDFSKLDAKGKFRLERKHKRRVKICCVNPQWDKFWRIFQMFAIWGTVIYSAFFMEYNGKKPRDRGDPRYPLWRWVYLSLPWTEKPAPRSVKHPK